MAEQKDPTNNFTNHGPDLIYFCPEWITEDEKKIKWAQAMNTYYDNQLQPFEQLSINLNMWKQAINPATFNKINTVMNKYSKKTAQTCKVQIGSFRHIGKAKYTKMEKATNKHHLLAKSLGGSNNPLNLIEMDINRHTAFHLLYDRDTFDQFIRKLLRQYNIIFTTEFLVDIMNLLNNMTFNQTYKQQVHQINLKETLKCIIEYEQKHHSTKQAIKPKKKTQELDAIVEVDIDKDGKRKIISKDNEPIHSRHHIIPRQRGGMDSEHNIIKMLHKRHKHIHGLFGNLLPHEQIEELLLMYQSALKPGFVDNILAIMEEAKAKARLYKKGVRIYKDRGGL